jgi:LacI family transcriptional regulator
VVEGLAAIHQLYPIILISSSTFIAHNKSATVKPEKEITIYDIAKQLNISPATVSRALNDNPSVSVATKKKVNALAERLGYRHNLFASSLRLQKTHTIGVIVHELNSYFITSVLAGIEA